MTIQELKEWYEGRELPTGSLKINSFSTIGSAAKFVDQEFKVLEAHPDSKAYDSCRLRLIEFKNWLESKGLA